MVLLCDWSTDSRHLLHQSGAGPKAIATRSQVTNVFPRLAPVSYVVSAMIGQRDQFDSGLKAL